MHISIRVRKMGYLFHATAPIVEGLWAASINNIIHPFQYKFDIAKVGGT